MRAIGVNLCGGSMYCSSCGAKAENTASFCGRCGSKLGKREEEVSTSAPVHAQPARRFAPFLIPAWLLLILSCLGVLLCVASLIEGGAADEMLRDGLRGVALLGTAAFGLAAVLRRASTGNYVLAGLGPFVVGVATPLGLILMITALATTWLYRREPTSEPAGTPRASRLAVALFLLVLAGVGFTSAWRTLRVSPDPRTAVLYEKYLNDGDASDNSKREVPTPGPKALGRPLGSFDPYLEKRRDPASGVVTLKASWSQPDRNAPDGRLDVFNFTLSCDVGTGRAVASIGAFPDRHEKDILNPDRSIRLIRWLKNGTRPVKIRVDSGEQRTATMFLSPANEDLDTGILLDVGLERLPRANLQVSGLGGERDNFTFHFADWEAGHNADSMTIAEFDACLARSRLTLGW